MIVLGDLERDPLAHWADIQAHESRLIVVEGVTVMPGSPRHDDPLKEWPIVKPFPDLVAATEPCRTCGGLGVRFVDRFGQVYGNRLAEELNLVATIPCPDCIDGRPKVAVWTECQHHTCGEDGGIQGWDWTCDHWLTDEMILLGHVTVEAVLPIVDDEVNDDVALDVINVWKHGLEILRGTNSTDITHELTHHDPDTIVGKFGVLIAAVVA